MSTIAANLSAVSTKIKVGAAAAAIGTAAVMTPAVAAHADIAAPLPAAPAVTDIMASPVLNALNYAEQGSWIYFGPAKPDGGATDKTTYFEFAPIVLVPGFLKPFFGWAANLSFEACLFGFSVSVGPYGTLSAAVGRGC